MNPACRSCLVASLLAVSAAMFAGCSSSPGTSVYAYTGSTPSSERRIDIDDTQHSVGLTEPVRIYVEPAQVDASAIDRKLPYNAENIGKTICMAAGQSAPKYRAFTVVADRSQAELIATPILRESAPWGAWVGNDGSFASRVYRGIFDGESTKDGLDVMLSLSMARPNGDTVASFDSVGQVVVSHGSMGFTLMTINGENLNAQQSSTIQDDKFNRVSQAIKAATDAAFIQASRDAASRRTQAPARQADPQAAPTAYGLSLK